MTICVFSYFFVDLLKVLLAEFSKPEVCKVFLSPSLALLSLES